jgi:hypothetical protein
VKSQARIRCGAQESCMRELGEWMARVLHAQQRGLRWERRRHALMDERRVRARDVPNRGVRGGSVVAGGMAVERKRRSC